MEIKQSQNITYFIVPKTEIQSIDFVLCQEPRQTLEKFYNAAANKPDILINGGFFNLSDGATILDFIDDYFIRANEPYLDIGIGITPEGELKVGSQTEVWKDFLTAYPPLLQNGQLLPITFATEISSKNRRSILGYNNDNVYLIVIDSPGATLQQAGQIAKDIGCTDAVNLDGGGSTRALCQGQVYAAASYNRPVDNVIAVYLKQKTFFRVQLGAFSSKTNAQNFCNQIQKLGASYKSAYVRYVAPYYKVQVGAFTIKQNAINMMNDLKSKGYNAFITT